MYALEETVESLTEEELGWSPAGRLSSRHNDGPRPGQEL